MSSMHVRRFKLLGLGSCQPKSGHAEAHAAVCASDVGEKEQA